MTDNELNGMSALECIHGIGEPKSKERQGARRAVSGARADEMLRTLLLIPDMFRPHRQELDFFFRCDQGGIWLLLHSYVPHNAYGLRFLIIFISE